MEESRTVVFVCPHGAAKSVMAAAYLEQLADRQGKRLRATAAGLDPDPSVPPRVAELLLAEGIDVRGHEPRRVTAEELATAWRAVTFGCDLGPLAPAGLPIDRWDDVPALSENLEAGRVAIRARVTRLLAE